MPVLADGEMKCLLDSRHRRFDVQQGPSWMSGRHFQAAGRCEHDERVVVCLAGAELFRELFGREVAVVIRAGRVVKALKEI